MSELKSELERETAPPGTADGSHHNGHHPHLAQPAANGTALREYLQLEQRQYGSLALKRESGPNLLRGFVVSVIAHTLVLLIPMLWMSLRPAPDKPRERVVVLDMSQVTRVTPPREEPPQREEGAGGEGGEAVEVPRLEPPVRASRSARGQTRNFLRESGGRTEAFSSVEVQPSALFSAVGGLAITTTRRAEGGGGTRMARDFSGTRGAALGGTGDGPAIGAGADFGNGGRNGLGEGAGTGHGRGSRLGDGTGRGEPRLGGGSVAAPSLGGSGDGAPELAVIKVPPVPAEVNLRYDRSPLIDWMESHPGTIPSVLRTPENLDQRPGDLTAVAEFTDSESNHYVMYLLGRRSQPPQLNLFLITNGKGTLLQDEGAKGASEVFKFGPVTGSGSSMAVQLQQLPPGRREARAMMAVFNAWWKQTQRGG